MPPMGSQETWVSPVYLSSVLSRLGLGQDPQALLLAAACWLCSQISTPLPQSSQLGISGNP